LEDTFESLNRLSGKIGPGAGGHIVLPYFQGARAPYRNPLASGMILGLRKQSSPEQIYKACLEAAGFSIRTIIEETENITGNIEKIYSCGGGAINSLLIQTVSDITGKVQVVPENEADPLVGCGLLLLHGLGISKYSASDRKGEPPGGSLFTPEEKNNGIYESYYRLYKELSRNMMPAMELLNNYK
jgi:xylulokinase